MIQLNWGSFGILDALLILNIFYEKCSHSYVPITEKGYWQVTAAVNLPLNLKGCGFGAWKWKLKWEFIWCIGWIAPATNLNLSHNLFTGMFPVILFSLQNLEVLDLNDNHFSGSMTAAVNLPLIRYFYVSFNLLEGTVDATICANAEY